MENGAWVPTHAISNREVLCGPPPLRPLLPPRPIASARDASTLIAERANDREMRTDVRLMICVCLAR